MQTGVPSRALCCLFSLMQIYSFWNSRKSGKQTFKMVMWLKSEPVPLTVRLTHSTFSSFAFLFPYFFVLLGIYWISVWYFSVSPQCAPIFSSVCSNIPSASMRWNPKEVAFLWFKYFFKFVLLPLLFPSKAYFFTEALGDHLSYFVMHPSPKILLG